MKRVDMIKKLQLAEAKAWVVMMEWGKLFGHNEQYEIKASAWNSLASVLLTLNLEPDRELRAQLIEADIKCNGVLGINFN
jgi:hypothetical protein